MTTDSAKDKWCPLVRAAVNEDGYNANNCGMIKPDRIPDYAHCIAADCMMWRFNNAEQTTGYCGLAGKP